MDLSEQLQLLLRNFMKFQMIVLVEILLSALGCFGIFQNDENETDIENENQGKKYTMTMTAYKKYKKTYPEFKSFHALH